MRKMNELCESYTKSKSYSFHGSAYELYLLIIFILRSIKNEYSFKLSAQSIDAEKFDDVVCEIKDKRGNEYCRYLQAKHAQNDKKEITYDMLISNKNAPFALSKYFISYLKIVGKLTGKAKLYDLIIFTNKAISSRMEEENCVRCEDEETILNFTKCYEDETIKRLPKRLRLNYPGNEVLCMLKETYLRYIIAQALAKSIKHKQILNIVGDIFVINYLRRLDIFEEISRNSNVVSVKFKEKFFQNSKANEFKDLRTIFFELFEESPIDDINVESLKHEFKKRQFLIHSDCLEDPTYEVEWPEDYVGHVEIKDFLNKLKFYTDQPNQMELAEYMKQSNDILIDHDFIDHISLTNNLVDFVTRWMAKEAGTYITDESVYCFFEKMNLQISKFVLINASNYYKCQLRNFNMAFEENSLEHYLKQSANVLSCIETSCMLLTAIKLQQFFDENSIRKTVIFLSPECDNFVLKNAKNILHCAEIFFVVAVNDEKKCFFDELLNTNLKNGIFILTNSSKLKNKFKNYRKKIDKDVTMSDLTEQSKDLILNREHTVIFQGQTITLQDLLLNEDSITSITSNDLYMIITDQLKIGNDIVKNNDVETFYIERNYLQKTVYLKPSFKSLPEIFYVTTKLSELQWKKKEVDKKQVIIIVENDVDIDLRNYVIENIVHLILAKGDKYIWKSTKTKLSDLRKHFDKIVTNVRQTILDKFVILAAEPGMGKTTLFNHLMYTIKETDPSLWMLKLNLIEYSNQLKTADFDEDQEVINFLCKATKITTTFEKALITQELTTRGKVMIFLDGYDEINELCRNNTVRLIEKLRSRFRTKQVWISTRLHFKNLLEDSLGYISYDLKDLSEEEQAEFLVKYWQKDNEIFDDSDDFKEKAQAIIDLINKSITSNERQFMGIPLQTRMVAEIYNYDDELPTVVDLLSLYDKFIDKKFEVFLKEKIGITNIGLHCDELMDKYRSDFDYNCKLLAIKILYPGKADLWLQYFPDSNLSIEKFTLTGFIGEIINDLPQFVHRTFAEYFASKWFIENLHRVFIYNYLKEHFFMDHFHVVRHFIERLLLDDDKEKMILHRHVLNKDIDSIKCFMENCDFEELFNTLNSRDKAGRAPLHLACSYSLWTIIEILLSYVANTQIRDNLFNWIPVDYLPTKNTDNNDILKQLLQSDENSVN